MQSQEIRPFLLSGHNFEITNMNMWPENRPLMLATLYNTHKSNANETRYNRLLLHYSVQQHTHVVCSRIPTHVHVQYMYIVPRLDISFTKLHAFDWLSLSPPFVFFRASCVRAWIKERKERRSLRRDFFSSSYLLTYLLTLLASCFFVYHLSAYRVCVVRATRWCDAAEDKRTLWESKASIVPNNKPGKKLFKREVGKKFHAHISNLNVYPFVASRTCFIPLLNTT